MELPLTLAERDALLAIPDVPPTFKERLRLALLKNGFVRINIDAREINALLGAVAVESSFTRIMELRNTLKGIIDRINEITVDDPASAPNTREMETAVDEAVAVRNRTPLDDFCGLSPEQMHFLLYEPYGEHSPVTLRTDVPDAILDEIRFFRLAEELLKILQRDRFIKLTPLGALPKKYLHELYDHHFIPEESIDHGISKLTREIDSISISSVHHTMNFTGLTKKVHGKLMLTKQGVGLLHRSKRTELFRLILRTFTNKFNWGYNDRYTKESAGQIGWGFTIYLLSQFGKKTESIEFYARKYLRAFPFMVKYFKHVPPSTPEMTFVQCYCTRVFERFLQWFGFADVGPANWREREKALVTRTRVFEEVWHV